MRFVFGPTATLRTAADLVAGAQSAVAAAVDIEADCTSLEQCDCAGLQVLVSLRTTLQRNGRQLRVRHVPPATAWRFRLMGLESADM